MFWGMLFGLSGASLQALSYLFSRHYLTKHGTPIKMMLASQLMLGIVSALALPFLDFDFWQLKLLWPLLLVTLAFLFGQVFFLRALTLIESSRMSSIIGLKLIFVPLFLYLFFDYVFNWGQIIALVLAVAATLLMNYHTGGRFHWSGMGCSVIAVVLFAWSDIGIKFLIKEIDPDHFVRAGLIGILMNNVTVVVLLLPMYFKYRLNRTDFTMTAGFTGCWGFGLFCLFVSFGFVGPVFGNVLQSVRGPVGLVLGIAAARLGMQHLELRNPAIVWVQRGIAALLMFGAVVLYAVFAK